MYLYLFLSEKPGSQQANTVVMKTEKDMRGSKTSAVRWVFLKEGKMEGDLIETATAAHLRPAEKQAPPRPRNPDFDMRPCPFVGDGRSLIVLERRLFRNGTDAGRRHSSSH